MIHAKIKLIKKYIFPIVYGTCINTLVKNMTCVIPIAIEDGYKQADVLLM